MRLIPPTEGTYNPMAYHPMRLAADAVVALAQDRLTNAKGPYDAQDMASAAAILLQDRYEAIRQSYA